MPGSKIMHSSQPFKHLVPVFCVFLFLQILFFAPRLNSDGAYYYEYVRSLVIQNDLNFDDEREFFTWEFVPVLENINRSHWEDTGYRMNIFAFGTPMVWMPVYVSTHGLITVLNKFGADLSRSGYGLSYRFPSMVLSMLTGILAILFMDRIGAYANIKSHDRVASLLLIISASHYPAFLFVTPAFSHAMGVMIMSAFFFAWYRWRDAGWGITGHALYGAVAGIAVATRWQNAFCLVLPFIDAMIQLIFSPDKKKFRTRFIHWMAFAGMLLLVVSPQLVVTNTIYGTPITDPQGQGGMKWLEPKFMLTLFESNKGLFVVNPILLIAVVGVPFIFLKNFRMAWGFILAFLIQTYINAVRRDWSGVGFGMRRFLNLLPIFALGLSIVFDRIGNHAKKIPRLLLWLIGICFALWNILLMAQYYLSELGAPWHSVPIKKMITNQFNLSPHLLFELFKSGLIGAGLHGNMVKLFLGILTFALTLMIIIVITRYRPGKLFGHNKSIIAVVAFFLWILTINVWILIAVTNTQTIYAVGMTPGRHFGQLKKLTINRSNGYQGTPEGLVFGPKQDACLFKVDHHYDPNRFLALGKMNRYRKRPCMQNTRIQLKFLPFKRFRGIELISRINTSNSIVEGHKIADLLVMSDTGGLMNFPIRYGLETGLKNESNTDEHSSIILRNYPAIHPIYSQKIYDTRHRWFFDGSYKIKGLIIEAYDSAIEFQIHGIAFYE